MCPVRVRIRLTGTTLFLGSRQERNGKFSMPLIELGQKKYYIGLFFKVTLSSVWKTKILKIEY